MQKCLWLYLCTQDWFNIPFANAHAIAPNHCTTPLPLNCDGVNGFHQDGDAFKALPKDTATQMTYMLNIYQGLIRSGVSMKDHGLICSQLQISAEAFSTEQPA